MHSMTLQPRAAGCAGHRQPACRTRVACRATAMPPPPTAPLRSERMAAAALDACDLTTLSNAISSSTHSGHTTSSEDAPMPAALAASCAAARGGLVHTPATPAAASSPDNGSRAGAAGTQAPLLSLHSFSTLPHVARRNRLPPAAGATSHGGRPLPADALQQPHRTSGSGGAARPASRHPAGERRRPAVPAGPGPAAQGEAAAAALDAGVSHTPTRNTGPTLGDLNLGWGSWRHKRKWEQEQRARRREGPFKPFSGDGAAARAALREGATPRATGSQLLSHLPQGQRLSERGRVHSLSSAALAAAVSEPMDVGVLDASDLVYVHLALTRLGRAGSVELVQRLARYALARPDRTTHTWGSAFGALEASGRADLAVSEWHAAARARVDIGPVGASALVKVAARGRDVSLALDLFDSLLKRRVTLNRFCYNCVVHVCALAGRVDDMLAVYNLMRLETHRGSTPDVYTYSALLRGVLVGGRHELVGQLYENMIEDDVVPDSVLWCHLVTAASRASNPRLAVSIYRHMLEEGAEPSVHTVNALMTAQAGVGNLAATQKLLHQELLGRGLTPDTYTAVAVLTAAARSRATFAAVQAIWSHMTSTGVPFNEFVGTALLTAYRHAPSTLPASPAAPGDGVGEAGVGAPAVAAPAPPVGQLLGTVPDDDTILAQARSVLAQLKASKQANANAYTAMMALCLSRQRRAEATLLLREAEESGVALPPVAFATLARACEEYGLPEAAAKMWERSEALEAELAPAEAAGHGGGGAWT